MKRVHFQRVLKGINRLRKLPRLHIRRAQKIPRVGIVSIKLDYVMEGVNRALRVAGIFRQQP
jgi:hypothetical protein